MELEFAEATSGLKPDNACRIWWANGVGVQTPVSVLYLHGFSASPQECGEVPMRIAEALGANLLMSRLAGHGVDALRFTLDELVAGVEADVAEAAVLGGRLIVIASSMGAAVAMKLIGEGSLAPAALVMWSPGVAAHDNALLDQLCSMEDWVTDPRPRTEANALYWSPTVHPGAYRAMRDLFVENAQAKPWRVIQCPTMVAFYPDDKTGSVAAMRDMWTEIAGRNGKLIVHGYLTGAHVVASPYKSAAWHQVLVDTVAFLKDL